MTTPQKGTLYLVPTPLDFGCDASAPLADVLPQETLRVASTLTHWISENAKSTRAFLKRVNQVTPLALSLQDMQITELPRAVHKKGDHQGEFDARPLLALALKNIDIGLVSEAGMPAVADPGSSVVLAAHHMGIRVVPLVGPVSLLLALAASGLNGQNFAFVGYLPQDNVARVQRIRELEALSIRTGQTQLFIETPYRNKAMWQALLQTLQTTTRLARASGLTLPTIDVQCHSVKDWRLSNDVGDAPTVFAIGK
jgi:16S rRNA (cytidine1402-2'-O)-methyltransferase